MKYLQQVVQALYLLPDRRDNNVIVKLLHTCVIPVFTVNLLCRPNASNTHLLVWNILSRCTKIYIVGGMLQTFVNLLLIVHFVFVNFMCLKSMQLFMMSKNKTSLRPITIYHVTTQCVKWSLAHSFYFAIFGL